jgi:hypothetical protein
MQHFSFSADDLAAIAFERYHHPEPFVQRKLEVLWLKHQGLTHDDIARLAGVCRSSVQRYLAEFLRGGLDANLNLIERVWKFVKKEALRAVYHGTYEEFTGAGQTHYRFSRIPSALRVSSRKSGSKAAAKRFLAMLSLDG